MFLVCIAALRLCVRDGICLCACLFVKGAVLRDCELRCSVCVWEEVRAWCMWLSFFVCKCVCLGCV